MAARFGAILLAAFLLLFGLAPFFASTNPDSIDPDAPFLPPEFMHFFDPATSRFHLRPFLLRPASDKQSQILATVPLSLFVRESTPGRPSALHLLGVRNRSGNGEARNQPVTPHWLGTDGLGRDLWSRLLFGGRTSIGVGLVAATITTLIATLVAVLSGFLGGFADSILMRLAETVMAVPWFYLLLAVRAMLPLRVSPWTAILISTLILALVGWARPARILRGVAMAERNQSWVAIARATGASPFHLIRWHILPALAPQALTQFTVLLPQFIAAEISLSYLGLGVEEPVVSWGRMLSDAQHLSTLLDHPWLLSPLWGMIPFFLAIHLVADSATSAPRLTRLLTLKSFRSPTGALVERP